MEHPIPKLAKADEGVHFVRCGLLFVKCILLWCIDMSYLSVTCDQMLP